MNDHVALRKLLGDDKLAFSIGLDADKLSNPNTTEDDVIRMVRTAIDTHGENGGMVLLAFAPPGPLNDVLVREAFEYSRQKYAKN